MASAAQIEMKEIIIIVDDDESVLEAARSAFKNESCDLYCFTKGEEALLFLKQEPSDAIVSDLRMPGMSGIEFLNVAARVAPEASRFLMGGTEDKAVGAAAVSKGLAQHFILKPWSEQRIRSLMHDSLVMRTEARTKELQVLLNSLTELPSAPQFHRKLNGLLRNDDKYLRLIIEEIEKNPALVAKLLRTANSVFFGARKNISNVNDAVRFIGVEYVSGLVCAIEAFYQIAVRSDAHLTGFIEGMWDDSLRRAELSKIIAKEWKTSCEPRVVYITSLLQDIGYVARMCDDPDLYKRFKRLSGLQRDRMYEIEMHIYTHTHDDLAASLLKFWNFPPQIISAIKKHHRFTGDDAEAQIIQVAMVLMNGSCDVPHDPALDPIIAEYREKLAETTRQFAQTA